jgi:hypothetical protein
MARQDMDELGFRQDLTAAAEGGGGGEKKQPEAPAASR